MKKKRMAVLAVALAAVVTVGALAATLGSADDPLVTLSYLTQVFRPQAVDSAADEAQDQVAAYQSSVSNQVSRAEQTMEQTEENLNALVGSDAFAARVAEQAGLDDPEGIEQTLWQTVTLSSGQTLTAGEGTQVLLRAGTAQAGGALVDLTGGKSLAAGGALQANHLYLLPQDGACLTATGAVTALVRGSYTIA